MGNKCREDDAESIGDLIEIQKVFVDLAQERLKDEPGGIGVLGTYHRELRKLKFLQQKLAQVQGISLSPDWNKEEPSSMVPPKKIKAEELVRGFNGRWVGRIHHQGGRAILEDRHGQVVAAFDPNKNVTVDASGQFIGSGDRLKTLLPGSRAA